MRLFLYLILFLFSFSFAHDLQHKVETGKNAVIIYFFFPDNNLFSYENFEIYTPDNQKIPFQVGRTDKLGRVILAPNQEGKWLIKVFSEDGHGKTVYIDVDKNLVSTENKSSLFNRYNKLITGISLLIGIFGIISLFLKRRAL